MATSKIQVTEGSGKNVATHSLTEDSVTKEVQRVNLNDSSGAEVGTASAPVRINPTGTTAQPVSQSGTWNSMGTQGSQSRDSVLSTNPLHGGGRASTAAPTSVSADGDLVDTWHTRDGAQVVAGFDGTNAQKLSTNASGHLNTSDTATQVDDAAFTPATGRVMMVGAELDDTTPDSVDEGDGGALRMSPNRNLYIQIADGQNNERRASVNSNNRLSVSMDNFAGVQGPQAIDAPITTNPVIGGGRASTATPSAVSADGDVQALWLQRTGSLVVEGGIAHDAIDGGNPLKIGGRADNTFQTATADGDMVDALFDVYGQLRTRTDHANLWSYHENSSSALTDTSVQAAPGAGLSIYVTDIVVSTGAATAFNIFFEEGATTVLGPYYLEATAGRGVVISFRTPKKITANTALTVTTSAAIAHSIDCLGFIAP